MPEGQRLLTTFRFKVALKALAGSPNFAGNGGFQECSGLDIELDIQEYLEGGRNDAVVRRVGRAKYQPIVLKRGMFHAVVDPAGKGAKEPATGSLDRTLWTWIQGIARGERPVQRCDGAIDVLGDGNAVMARWAFSRALPLKLAGPRLDAKTGDIAIEELHLAHEELRLEDTP